MLLVLSVMSWKASLIHNLMGHVVQDVICWFSHNDIQTFKIFVLQVEPCRYSIYREEALDGITLALNCCCFDQKVIPNSRKALLMLGGYFSSSGGILTEAWLLQQAGYSDGGVEESTTVCQFLIKPYFSYLWFIYFT